MADTHDGHAESGHHGPKVQTYLVIGAALAGFTAVSFVVNYAVSHYGLSSTAGFWIILTVAVVKATLVVLYFMHLIWDWRKVLFMIIPALILGAMWWIVMTPDIVLAWDRERKADPFAAAPVESGALPPQHP